VVHEVLRDAEVLHALSARFGAEIVRPDGSVDRARLGPLVFGDADGLAFLEGIIHPRVAARRREWVAGQDALTPRPALLVCEVPVLFEAGVEAEFDAVIVVTASDDVRRTRVEARGQSFVERQARQMPEHEKVARANRWFVNDGSLEDLGRWVAKCFGELAGRPCDN
jgi:dephospho-CoA kinase